MATTGRTPLLYLYNNDIPEWLQVLLGITACTATLLLLTCLCLCCMRLCGCWTGNIFGVGALKHSVGDTDHVGCWCCRPHIVTSRSRIDDGQISYTDVLNNSRRSTPKMPQLWMPHSKPVRENNSSTR